MKRIALVWLLSALAVPPAWGAGAATASNAGQSLRGAVEKVLVVDGAAWVHLKDTVVLFKATANVVLASEAGPLPAAIALADLPALLKDQAVNVEYVENAKTLELDIVRITLLSPEEARRVEMERQNRPQPQPRSKDARSGP